MCIFFVVESAIYITIGIKERKWFVYITWQKIMQRSIEIERIETSLISG